MFHTTTSPGKDIETAVTLRYGDWVMESWSGSGTSAIIISGSTEVIKGEEYVLRVSGTVDDIPFDIVRISGTC